jgi:hypothetical protein
MLGPRPRKIYLPPDNSFQDEQTKSPLKTSEIISETHSHQSEDKPVKLANHKLTHSPPALSFRTAAAIELWKPTDNSIRSRDRQTPKHDLDECHPRPFRSFGGGSPVLWIYQPQRPRTSLPSLFRPPLHVERGILRGNEIRHEIRGATSRHTELPLIRTRYNRRFRSQFQCYGIE